MSNFPQVFAEAAAYCESEKLRAMEAKSLPASFPFRSINDDSVCACPTERSLRARDIAQFDSDSRHGESPAC
jgi:hypothetical protein